MKYQGKCKCGAVRVGILSEPIMKYNCHCSHCRGFASRYEKEPAPYYASAFVWRWSVQVDGDIEFERSTGLGAASLFALQRGRCAACKQPVWEKGERLAFLYAMVAIPPLQGVESDTNIYYNSGLKQGTLGLKTTIYSDFGSLLYEVGLVMMVSIRLLPASIFALFGNRKFKED